MSPSSFEDAAPVVTVPATDLTTAGHLLGDTVHGVGTLRELVAGLHGEATLQRPAGWPSVVPAPGTDLADCRRGIPDGGRWMSVIT